MPGHDLVLNWPGAAGTVPRNRNSIPRDGPVQHRYFLVLSALGLGFFFGFLSPMVISSVVDLSHIDLSQAGPPPGCLQYLTSAPRCKEEISASRYSRDLFSQSPQGRKRVEPQRT